MHVGMAAIFQNPDGARSDRDVWGEDLRLACLAEPLGFESIWGVEHHFTDYTMCPDVLQFLSFLAARTERVKLGSMVVVLPWHDPMRVAEQVSVLDHLSDGRLVLGLGRGLGRVEFEGFRVGMQDSRAIFVESAQMLLEGLEKGYCEFEGRFVRQPRRDIRPRPFRSFRGRTYAAAVSPESSRIMAELGIGILIIPQKPWDTVARDLDAYRGIFREVNGVDAPPPVVASWVFCDEDPARAEELARRYIGAYWQSAMRHYELRAEHLKAIPGYESYGPMQEIARSDGGAEAMTDFFLGLQVWGTPDQCLERALDIRSRVGNQTFVGVFSYAGLPADEAERNMRLFAREVMPRLQALPGPAPRA